MNPLRDPERLAALARTRMLDAPSDPVLDRLARFTALALDVPTVLITLLDAERAILVSGYGLPERWAGRRERPDLIGCCGLVVERDVPVIVEDVRRDARLRDNAAVAEVEALAYAGVPIVSEQQVIGCICAMDRAPRVWTAREREAFAELGLLAGARIARQRDLAALRTAEEQFRGLAESSLAGIYAIQDGRFVYANPTFARIFGYTVDEILALPSILEIIAPEWREDVARRVGRRIAGEVVEERTVFRGVRKDGTAIDLEAHGTRATLGDRPAAIGTLLDVTERRRAERSVRESESELRAVLTAMHDVILVLDGNGRYLKVAHHGGDRLYTEPERLLGRTLHEVLPLEVANDFLDLIRRALAERRAVETEYRLPIRGIEYWFAATISPMDGNRVVWVARDVSEQVRAREALQEREAQLRQAQKMEAVGQLAGGVAHDFNNLLAAITLNAQLLAPAVHSAGAGGEELDEIRRAAERAAHLTRQLLAFGRRQVLQPTVLDLNRIVRDTELLLRRLVGERVAVVLELAPTLDCVRADAGQLAQVVMNLAVNARDAMPDGGRLAITTANHGECVVLTVRDTGIGMDEATRARIFEPFFTTKPPGKGTGLGLATVYGIVTQSGGRVEVESAPGRGTLMTVRLPRHAGPPAPTAAEAAPGALPSGTETVLLVEDERAVRSSVRRLLQRQGYTVLEARHGAEALGLLAERGGAVDLLLTDIVMPELGGRELADRARARWPHLRLLFMSGYDEDGAVAHDRLPPGSLFLEKPFTVETLLRMVRESLDSRSDGQVVSPTH